MTTPAMTLKEAKELIARVDQFRKDVETLHAMVDKLGSAEIEYNSLFYNPTLLEEVRKMLGHMLEERKMFLKEMGAES